MKKLEWSPEKHLKTDYFPFWKTGELSIKTTISELQKQNSQNIWIDWPYLDQNLGLIMSNNIENDAQIDDLSAKKAKNTPQPQNASKKQENVKKWHFYGVFERFPVKIQPISTSGHFKKFSIHFLRFKKPP